jgi:hypothetical protein
MTTYRADEPGTARRTLPPGEQNGTGTGAGECSRLDSALGDIGVGELRGRADPDDVDVRAPSGWRHVLTILVWRLGTGPCLDAVRTINGWSLATAAGIAAMTKVCCAWRWSLVARSLGVGMPMRGAVAAYYRSQLLNTTLPSGVLGDVHHAVRHGRDVGQGNRPCALLSGNAPPARSSRSCWR